MKIFDDPFYFQHAVNFIAYTGPSMLDGAPIVGIVTGLTSPSDNPKTGDMAQLWIIRADVHPAVALTDRSDASVCGGCIHRGDSARSRTCYVNIMGPASVYRSFVQGKYSHEWPSAPFGKAIRLGAYGDPAALPLDVLRRLIALAEGHTGYTHQWRDRAESYASIVMASCDNAEDYAEAKAKGYRTFRVLPLAETERATREIECVNTSHGTTCEQCQLCDGATATDKRKDIVITAHGTSARMYTGRV